MAFKNVHMQSKRFVEALCALLLTGCALFALCSCNADEPVSNTSHSLTVKNIGESFEVKGWDKGLDDSGNDQVAVTATLTECSIDTQLPTGYTKNDVTTYDEEYALECGLFTLDDNGKVSEGWSMITATVHYENENDFPCRLRLSQPHIALLKGETIECPEQSDMTEWVINGIPTKEDYYLPPIEAHGAADYLIALFTPNEYLSENTLLVIEDRHNASEHEWFAKAYAIGNICTQSI